MDLVVSVPELLTLLCSKANGKSQNLPLLLKLAENQVCTLAGEATVNCQNCFFSSSSEKVATLNG